eukprot:94081_1
MAEPSDRSILHPAPFSDTEIINLASSVTPQPPLKKRKLDATESITTSTDNSNTSRSSTETNSNDIETTSSKRKSPKRKSKKDIFSIYSIKKLLKADEKLGDTHISSEAATLIGKATQLFLDEMLKESIANSNNNQLEYDHIASYIDSKDKLAFLSDIVPTRVEYGQISNNIKKDCKDTADNNENNTSNTNNRMEIDGNNE